jgi:signal transduction histidine kinase
MRDDRPVTQRVRSREAAATLCAAALTCALVAAAVVLALAHDASTGRHVAAAAVYLSAVVPALLGARLVQVVPTNAVGRRLVWLGAALSWLWLADAVSTFGREDGGDPGAWWLRWAALFDDDSFMLVFWALAALVWVFPHGQPPSTAWGRRGRLAGRALAVGVIASTAIGTDLGRVDGREIVSPLPSSPWLSLVEMATILLLLAVLVVSAASVRWRLRRATGIERLQLWWLGFAAVLLPLTLAGCLFESLVLGGVGAITLVLAIATPLAIAAAVAVAVLRYRLYAIDRLVNRTLVYLVLTGILALAYAAIALVVGVGLGGGTRWTTAAATLAVAMAFKPARDRAQRAVDRRFNRRRYEALRRVERFLADVRAGRGEPERIGAVLADALGDRGLEVLFWLPASRRYAEPGGRLIDPPGPADPRARTPVHRGELELGLVLHAPTLSEHAGIRDDVLRAAGLAMEIARLRVEVRVQLAEVEASRARILATAEAERRRLERDLHDGAQQRLVALGLAVRHAQHLLDAGAHEARAALDGAIEEVTAAITEMRELARGLRPALLDAGLAPALADVARRAPMPIDVRVRADGLAAPIEAVAYYIACEAMTNAVKHSGAQRVSVRADRTDTTLRLEIADDGVGGARTTPGGGLAGLVDRVATHGGQLVLRSPIGAGTTVLAELPCAS